MRIRAAIRAGAHHQHDGQRQQRSEPYLRKALGTEQGHGWEGGYGGGRLEASSLVLMAQVLHDDGMQPAVHDPVSGAGARGCQLLLRLRRAGNALLDARPAWQALPPSGLFTCLAIPASTQPLQQRCFSISGLHAVVPTVASAALPQMIFSARGSNSASNTHFPGAALPSILWSYLLGSNFKVTNMSQFTWRAQAFCTASASAGARGLLHGRSASAGFFLPLPPVQGP